MRQEGAELGRDPCSPDLPRLLRGCVTGPATRDLEPPGAGPFGPAPLPPQAPPRY